MLSNIQHWLLDNKFAELFFDVLYVLFPVMLTIAVVKNWNAKTVFAYCTAIFSLLYTIFFSEMSYVSPELGMGWILMPLIFAAMTTKSFYYNMHMVRFIFVLIFFSAGIWKIKGGGLFNMDEMSGILVRQHNMYLVSNPEDSFARFLYYLIQHKALSCTFYLLGTLSELIFIIGLFTRKYDRLLIVAFCLFFCFDLFLMRINYFSWMVFMGCFYFSRFAIIKEAKMQLSNA